MGLSNSEVKTVKEEQRERLCIEDFLPLYFLSLYQQLLVDSTIKSITNFASFGKEFHCPATETLPPLTCL